MKEEKILLPWNMTPNIEKWEKIGFVFEPSDVPKMALVKLPKNWKSERKTWSNTCENENYCFEIKMYDDKDNLRAYAIHREIGDLIQRKYSYMQMLPRYYILDKKPDDGFDDVHTITFGNEEETLFIAGYYRDLSRFDDLKTINKMKSELQHHKHELEIEAQTFAETIYMNYKNPIAYWNNEKVKEINSYLLKTHLIKADYENLQLARKAENLIRRNNKIYLRKINDDAYCDELNYHIYERTIEDENIFYDRKTGLYFNINDLESTNKDIYELLKEKKLYENLYSNRILSQKIINEIEESHIEDEQERGIIHRLLLTNNN